MIMPPIIIRHSTLSFSFALFHFIILMPFHAPSFAIYFIIICHCCHCCHTLPTPYWCRCHYARHLRHERHALLDAYATSFHAGHIHGARLSSISFLHYALLMIYIDADAIISAAIPCHDWRAMAPWRCHHQPLLSMLPSLAAECRHCPIAYRCRHYWSHW